MNINKEREEDLYCSHIVYIIYWASETNLGLCCCFF